MALLNRPHRVPESGLPALRRTTLDPESRDWLVRLTSADALRRDTAAAELHALLLRAARFEVNRRRRLLPHLRGGDLEDLAMQSADDALMSVLGRLCDFRGDSRFTTWAFKFAVFNAGATLRKLAWQGREILLDVDTWARLPESDNRPDGAAEAGALRDVIVAAIGELAPRQREVLVAIALNGVPADVLAQRLGTSKTAVYNALHDARTRLRAAAARAGLDIEATRTR